MIRAGSRVGVSVSAGVALGIGVLKDVAGGNVGENGLRVGAMIATAGEVAVSLAVKDAVPFFPSQLDTANTITNNAISPKAVNIPLRFQDKEALTV